MPDVHYDSVRNDLSVDEAARRLEVHPDQLRRIEAGEEVPVPDLLVRMGLLYQQDPLPLLMACGYFTEPELKPVLRSQFPALAEKYPAFVDSILESFQYQTELVNEAYEKVVATS